MKTLKTLIVITIAVFGFSVTSFGQKTATATATGNIITPITITKTVDMVFGNIAVNENPGTVVLTSAGARSATGGVTVSTALGGSPTAASFTITGLANSTYAITLPASNTLKRASGTETMVVDVFTSSPSATGTLSSGGSQTLTVGATLNVAGNQVPGVYTSEAAFEVTVNYN